MRSIMSVAASFLLCGNRRSVGAPGYMIRSCVASESSETSARLTTIMSHRFRFIFSKTRVSSSSVPGKNTRGIGSFCAPQQRGDIRIGDKLKVQGRFSASVHFSGECWAVLKSLPAAMMQMSASANSFSMAKSISRRWTR